MVLKVRRDTILIVDDKKINRLLARAYLEMLGWKVDDCDGGLSALSYLRGGTPEYALLDIKMQDVDGLALVQKIREAYPLGTVKIVAYTAYTQSEVVELINISDFDSILFKPASLSDMLGIFGTKDQEIFSWVKDLG
jgi:two-component system chemotaxis response regulator CheY